MKKKALLASMMIMAAVSLAGCSGNTATKAADSSVTAGSEATESSATDSSAADTQKSSDTKEEKKDTKKEDKNTSADEPADPDVDSSASDVAAADDDVSYAAAFIGVSMDEFKQTFGQPTSSSVSTNDAGEELRTYTYDKFTVTTHTDSDGTEVIDDVE